MHMRVQCWLAVYARDHYTFQVDRIEVHQPHHGDCIAPLHAAAPCSGMPAACTEAHTKARIDKE